MCGNRNIILALLWFASAAAGWAQNRSPEELNRRGIQLANEGKYAEAIILFQEAIAIDDRKSSTSWHNLGFIYELAGDRQKAYQAYTAALDRNPSLVQTRANLGKIQYEMGLFAEAVQNGERVLATDPGNQEVSRWLPDAYRKAAEQRLLTLPKAPREETPAAEKAPAEKKRGVEYEIGSWVLGGVTYNKGNDAFDYHRQSGLTVVPAGVYARFTIDETFEFRFDVANPYMGILTPRFMAGQQRMEYLYLFRSFYTGFGLLFTQFNLKNDYAPGQSSFITNREYAQTTDTKFGLLLGTRNDKRMLEVAVYPRYLFRDPEKGPRQIGADHVRIDFEWRNRLQLFESATPGAPGRSGEFFLRLRFDEMYLTEYKYNIAGETIGHWFGVYDISLGMEFGSLNTGSAFGFSLTERLYFRDLSNKNPAAFGNGQGYFGLDTGAALEGNAFPGFRSNSHVVHFYMKQLVFSRLVLSQRLGLEITGTSEPVHALTLDLGFSMRF